MTAQGRADKLWGGVAGLVCDNRGEFQGSPGAYLARGEVVAVLVRARSRPARILPRRLSTVETVYMRTGKMGHSAVRERGARRAGQEGAHREDFACDLRGHFEEPVVKIKVVCADASQERAEKSAGMGAPYLSGCKESVRGGQVRWVGKGEAQRRRMHGYLVGTGIGRIGRTSSTYSRSERACITFSLLSSLAMPKHLGAKCRKGPLQRKSFLSGKKVYVAQPAECSDSLN